MYLPSARFAHYEDLDHTPIRRSQMTLLFHMARLPKTIYSVISFRNSKVINVTTTIILVWWMPSSVVWMISSVKFGFHWYFQLSLKSSLFACVRLTFWSIFINDTRSYSSEDCSKIEGRLIWIDLVYIEIQSTLVISTSLISKWNSGPCFNIEI